MSEKSREPSLDEIHNKMQRLIGQKIVEMLEQPDTPAAIINAAMKWCENYKNPTKNLTEPTIDPVLAATQRLARAQQVGGTLPPITDEQDPTGDTV